MADDGYSADGAREDARPRAGTCSLLGTATVPSPTANSTTFSTWLTENPQWEAVDTRCRVVTCITAFFNWALAEELIERSPYRLPSSLRGKSSHIRLRATNDEYVLLMRYGSRPQCRALYMLRKSGMRTLELRNLTWDEVFLDGPSPHLSLTRHKIFRTSGKRIIGLSASTASLLRNLGQQYELCCRCNCVREKCQADISPNVFTNCHGTPWDRHTFGVTREVHRQGDRPG